MEFNINVNDASIFKWKPISELPIISSKPTVSNGLFNYIYKGMYGTSDNNNLWNFDDDDKNIFESSTPTKLLHTKLCHWDYGERIFWNISSFSISA